MYRYPSQARARNEMVGRQGGLSGKQKAALLKGKRAQVAAKKDLSEHPPERSARTDDSGRAFVQQVSKKGSVNNLSTRFMREDDAVVAERRTQAQKPFATQYETALVCSPDGSLGLGRAWVCTRAPRITA